MKSALVGIVLGVSLALVAVTSSCSVSHRSDAFTCTTQADCVNGRTCVQGSVWCPTSTRASTGPAVAAATVRKAARRATWPRRRARSIAGRRAAPARSPARPATTATSCATRRARAGTASTARTAPRAASPAPARTRVRASNAARARVMSCAPARARAATSRATTRARAISPAPATRAAAATRSSARRTRAGSAAAARRRPRRATAASDRQRYVRAAHTRPPPRVRRRCLAGACGGRRSILTPGFDAPSDLATFATSRAPECNISRAWPSRARKDSPPCLASSSP